MTPQEENLRIQQQVNEELRAYSEAQRAATIETEKSAEIESKAANLTATGLQILEKLYNAQLQYTLSMAKGRKGASQFNDGIDAMTESMQMAAVAISLLIPGGPLIKGVVAGLTFLATQAMKTAAEMQKAANEQADATYKAFQAFSKAGATGTDGLKGFFNDVNRMRLNVHQLDAMAGVMANSAKEMSAMGGTVYKARGQFADLVQGMGDYEQGMINLGMSYDEQAEAAMGYMKLQSNLSQGQQKDYGKLSGGLKKYLQETEALTRVTGLSRKEQEAVQEKFMAQQRFGAKVQELRDNGQNEAADLLVSQMKKYASKGEMFAQAFADSSTGMLTSEAALKGNISSMGTIMADATGITEGRIKTEEEANASFQGVVTATKDMTKSMNMSYQTGVGEEFLLPLKEGAEITKAANQDFAKQIKEASEEVKDLINSTDKVDDQLIRFGGLLKSQNEQMLALQKQLNGQFSTGAADGGFGEFIGKLIKAFQPLIDQVMKLVNVFTPLVSGLGDLLLGAITALVKIMTGDIMGGLIDFKAGWDSAAKGLEETTNRWVDATLENIKNFAGNLLKSVEFITGPLGPVFENVGKTVSGFGDSVKTGLAKFTDALVDVIKDLFNKLTALIPGFGKAKEIVGNVAAKGAEYAQTGADAVKNAGDSVVGFVSSVFGGATAPARGAPTSAPAGGAPTSAPAGGAPTSAPAGGAPTSASARGAPTSAPAGGAPTSAPAGGAASTTAKNVAAGNSELAKFTNLAANISKFESGVAGYNAYNKGTVGNKMIGSDKSIDFSKMTIAEFLKRGSLKSGDPDRIFAMGKYQIIPATMESLVKKLKLDPATTVLDANTQDLLFTEGLVNQTRTNVAAYLSGKSDNRDAAILDLAKEFASVGVPYPAGKAKERGESYYAGIGGNKAHNSPDQVGAALDADRQNKVSAATGGVFDGPKSGYAATLHGMEAVIPLKDGAVPVSMSQEFNMTAVNLGELVNQMRSNMALQASMLAVMEDIRRSQNTTADNTGKMVTYASN